MTQVQATATEQQPISDRSRWIALYVLCIGMLMIVLDITVVNVALPSIKDDLGFSQSSLAWVVNAYLITFGGLLHPGVFTLVMIFGIFGWFYPARIIRSQILSLREKEFIEAARMTGASDWRIMRSHLLPHLVAPLIVFSTLIVATNVIAEAGLSFLGLGIPAPTASWGNLLAEGPNYYRSQPWLMVWPGLAILLTTLAFNLLGDGLRDAFDPRAAR